MKNNTEINELLEKIILPVDNYYELLTYENRNNFCVGQIVKGFVSYPVQKDLQILTVDEYDPTEINKAKYEITNFNFDDFESGKYCHRPIAGDQLESDEYYVIQKGKLRSCIILNKYKSKFSNGLYEEEIYLCLPLFSLKKKHDLEYILNILKFDIPDCFFFPTGVPGIKDHSAARFSRILPLYKKNLRAVECASNGNKPFQLTKEAYNLLMYHLSQYFCFEINQLNKITELIKTYKELITESINITV